MKKGEQKEIDHLKKSLIENKSIVFRLECDLRRYKEEVAKIEKELEWCENNYQ